MSKQRWYLGTLKGESTRVFLEDFSWDCGWFWGGGHVVTRDMHTHFDGCFLNAPDSRGHSLSTGSVYFTDPWSKPPEFLMKIPRKVILNGAAVWEPLEFFLDDPQYTSTEWWRIKDLFKQFYKLRDAAEVFQHGGHCTSDGRTPEELVPGMATRINEHIRDVIIPRIRLALTKPIPG